MAETPDEAFYRTYVSPMYEEYIGKTQQKIDGIEDLLSAAYKLRAKGDNDEALAKTVQAGFVVGRALLTIQAREATALYRDADRRRWCACAPAEAVREKFEDATKQLKTALDATANAESTAAKSKAVEACKSAANAYNELMVLFDSERLGTYKTFAMQQSIKGHGVGFVIGLTTSAIVTVAAAYWPSNKDKERTPGAAHTGNAASDAASSSGSGVRQ